MTRKEQLNALGKYLTKRFPDREDWVINTHNDLNIVNLPDDLAAIARTFFDAVQIGYTTHAYKANKYFNETINPIKERVTKLENNLVNCKQEAFENYNKGYMEGLLNIVTGSYANAKIILDKHFEEGYKKGSTDQAIKDSDYINTEKPKSFNSGYAMGQEDERANSYIPSDAYDVEVFAVQPSADFATGQQAFIGFKYDIEKQPQFGFIQVQYSVTNPIKKYGNDKINNEEIKEHSAGACGCYRCTGIQAKENSESRY
jgi:hypothetical protein